jgi:uncharacterized Zn-binding protein involved in type VI secretion
VVNIAQVATNGGHITESIKENHVTYSIESWEYQYSTGGGTDSQGNQIPIIDHYDWEDAGTGSTGAKITGTIQASNPMKINGVSVAKIGDRTNETWTVSPPIPNNSSTKRYTATSPISGSGQGLITGGNGKNVKLNGQLIAILGSEVTTCLGNKTSIADGNNLINM